MAQRIDFPAGRPSILTIAFTVLWLAGWLFLLVLTALDYQRFTRLSRRKRSTRAS